MKRAASESFLSRLTFEAEIIHWRGPAPHFFAPIPGEHVPALQHLAKAVSYGWGMIPVEVAIAGAAFTTSLFPKDGTYLLPIKLAVRRRTGITAGDTVRVNLTVAARKR